ncbi:hypothetical protein N9L76_01740 [bacterium]|nr:hypothetical protein [bacterium]
MKRIQKPGPCAGACCANNRWARKNFFGSSRMSVNLSLEFRMMVRRKLEDSTYVTPRERRCTTSSANAFAQAVLFPEEAREDPRGCHVASIVLFLRQT